MGGLGAQTGLGGFLGAGDVGGYSGAATAGLMTTADGLRHLAGNAAAPDPAPLAFDDPSNLNRWAQWVRGSLYISEVFPALTFSTDPAAQTVTLDFDGAPMVTLARPSDALLADQIEFVSNYADLRPDRASEITSQLGFPTEYFAMILGLHVGQHPKTFELLMAVQVMAAHAAMIVKHALAVRRPDQIDGRILPMIPTPGHGSFPSAHATEAYTALTVLEGLVGAWGSLGDMAPRLAMLRGLAERIAVNRTVAGVHYPIDSWAGAALGTALGRALLGRCGQAPAALPSLSYTAQNSDFNDHDFTQSAAAHGLTEGPAYSAAAAPNFTWLWDLAAAEHQAPAGV
ncbi:hypothetical protein NBRC116596_28420 [Litorivita sp. NS0012-18]